MSRRCEAYFQRRNIDAWDFFRQRRKPYERKDWLKLAFDGQVKRCHAKPKGLDELFELARKRFGVLRHILMTGQFKPLLTFKSSRIAKLVLIETTNDLEELMQLIEGIE